MSFLAVTSLAEAAMPAPSAAGGALPVVASLLVGAGLAGVAVARRTGTARLRALVGVALAALAFQVFHLAEHGLQLGHWLLHPTEAPWLTPWAAVGRDALAAAVDGVAASGAELLHLVGNGLFLAGLVALSLVAAQRGVEHDRTRSLRAALLVQGLHVAEHVLLTTSWFLAGEAWGASTVFGLLEPGTVVAGAVRVWFHFAVNLAATALAVRALRDVGADDLLGLLRETRRDEGRTVGLHGVDGPRGW